MGLNLGVMSAAVVLDDSDYRRKLSGLEGASENTFKRIAKLAAGYLSTRALFGFVQGAMAEFSKLEEGNNKLIHSYKELGNEAIRVAEGIAKEYGLANQTASNAIADIGDMLTGLGFESRDALNFAKKITLRGIDIASFKGLDQSETIRRMTVALTGETESLKSMGIVVRQGSEEFKEHVQSIMDATGATETMAKAQVILKEIMEQSKNAAGDYKNPGRTYAQELSDLKEAVKQFKAEIGNQIQPITQETVVKARELLQWYNKLTPSTKSLLNVTTALASALLILNKTSFGKSIMNAKGASDAEVQAQQAKAREEVIRAENQKTTAQMEKNLAEQNLALAKNATSAAENAEEHARAALTRAQASGAATIASAQQVLAQATKATTQAKLNEAKASETLQEKNVALTTATERFSTLSAALPGLLTSISASASLAGKMSIFMSGGFKAAATSVKTFLTSIGPVGWAIIAAAVSFEAVSLAVSLYNGKLEENARLAKEAADAAANASSKNADETRSKVSAMERLKELQKYEKLNNAEKEEAKELLKNLGIAYDENAASIDAMISKQGAEKKSLAEIIAMRKEELKQQRLAALQKQIEANQEAIAANDKRRVGLAGDMMRGAVSLGLWTGKAKNAEIDEENRKHYEAIESIRAEFQRLQNDEQKLGETEEERSRNNSESAKKLRDELKSISEKEWKIKFDSASAYDQVDMLTAKMDEAFSELKRKGKFTSIEQFKTSDRTKMNSEELDALKKIIDLEQQRANINKRITDERKQAAEALRSAQENRAYQNADEAGKIASLDKRIAEKQAELKNKRVRVDAEASPEKISELEQKIAELKDRRVKVDAEANPEQIAALEKQLAELKDKRIKVDADASPEKIEALEKQLAELKDKRVKVETEASPEYIVELEKELSELKDKWVNINVEASPEKIAALEQKLSELKDKRIKVDAEASADQITALKKQLSELKDKRVKIDTEASPEKIAELEKKIAELKNKRVNVDTEASTEQISALETRIAELKDRRVRVDTEASPEKITELEKQLLALKDKRVNVDVEASPEKISELGKQIAELKNKRVRVDAEANQEKIAELEQKLSDLKDKRIKVDAEANPEEIKALEKHIFELKNKRIRVDTEASPEQIAALETRIAELKDRRVRVDAEANPEQIAALETRLAELKDRRVRVDAEANPEQIEELERKLSELKNKRVRVNTEASSEQISALEEKLSKLKDKRVKIDAEADSKQIEELEARLKELKDRRIKVDSEANPERIIELEKKISELKNKRVKVDTEASQEQILELEKRIKDLKDKRVEVDAEASTDKISELEKKISALKDKRVKIDAEADPKQISDLEKKLSELKNKAAYTKEELELQQKIVRLEQQRDEIRKRSAETFASEKKAYEKMYADLRKRERDQSIEREIEAAKQKGDTSGVTEIMKRELDRAKQAADLMRSQYEQALKSAEADSIMTEEEKKRLQELRSKLQDALSDQNSWQSKVADQEKKDKSMKKEAVAWSSEVLNAQLGGMLKPQEDMAKNTKRIANIALSIERKMNKKQGEVLS